MRIDSNLPAAPPSLLDSKAPLIASVDVTGGPLIVGAGARNTAAGLNWMVLGVDALGAGGAALKALQGQKLTPDDKIIVNGYFEANAGNSGPMGKLLQALFGTGNLGMEAGCNLQVTLSGGTNGGLRVSKVTAFPLGIMAQKGALAPATYRRFSSPASLHTWEFPERGGVRYSAQVANKEGSFTQLKSGASGKGAIDLGKFGNALGIDGLAYGWVEFPGGGAIAPGLIKNHIPGRVPGSPASGSTVGHKLSDAAIAGVVVRDMVGALSGKEQLDSNGQPLETKLRGWARMIVKPWAPASPVGMLIEANSSITARQDGKDEIRFLLSNSNKPFFTTSASKLQSFGNGVMNAVESATRSLLGMDEVERMVSTGAYRPSQALRRMHNFDPRYTRLVHEASVVNQATQRAVASGLADPKAVGQQWAAVLEGRINAGLSGRSLVAGKLLAATVLGRTQDVDRLTEQLFPSAINADGSFRPAGLPGRYPKDTRSALQSTNTPVGLIIEGHRVLDAQLVRRDIGNEVAANGVGLQGSLMRGRTPGGTPVYWLQGQRTNYILRNANHSLVTSAAQAERRAKEYIRYGMASDLRPLDLRHASPRAGSLATAGNTRSVDGVAIVGGGASITWVGAEVSSSHVGRQGLLMWGRTPKGALVFWLQGRSENRVLRDDSGAFVTSQSDAIARAKQLIRFGGMQDLRPMRL
jgi:hypothetical protein